MQTQINESKSASDKKEEVSGFPFGNATSGASGSGEKLHLFIIALIVLAVALFYFGYCKEKIINRKTLRKACLKQRR